MMGSKLLGRIGVRLAAPAMGLLLLSLVLFVWFEVREVERRGQETLENYASLLSRLVVTSVRDSMLNKDRARIQRQLGDLVALDTIDAVRVVNLDGRVTFATDGQSVGQTLSTSAPSCKVCHQPGKPPRREEATLRFTDESGHRVFRAVQPILADASCLGCHKRREVGDVLGILLTDLDEDELTGGLKVGAERSVGLVALAVASVSVALLFGVRWGLLRRLHDVRGLITNLREGVLAPTHTAVPRDGLDELDELSPMVQALAADLRDRLGLERAANRVTALIDGHSSAALLFGPEGSVLTANRRARILLAGPDAAPLEGRHRAELPQAPDMEMLVRVREQGWVLCSDEMNPAPGVSAAVVAISGAQGALAAYLEVWPEQRVDDHEEDADLPSVPAASAMRVWTEYTVALALAARPSKSKRRGVLQFDRTLAAARRLAGEIVSLAVAVEQECGMVDLGALCNLARSDAAQVDDGTEWSVLAEPGVSVRGHPFLLHALVDRLAQAAAEAAQGGEVVLFARPEGAGGRMFLGAWASVPEAAVRLDRAGGPPLARAVAALHGGGVEIDPRFDISTLARVAGAKVRGTVGTLYLARLEGGHANV